MVSGVQVESAEWEAWVVPGSRVAWVEWVVPESRVEWVAQVALAVPVG